MRQTLTDIMHAFCSLLFLTSTLYVSIICSIHDTRFQGVTWDDTAWVVKTTNIDQGHYQSRLSIANGYLGINVAAVGPFFEQDVQVSGDNVNGWPLFNLRQTFATIAGFFDSQPTTEGTNFPWLGQYGWDSVISGVPHWGGIVLDCNGPNGVYLYANVDSTTISNFSSSLDAKRGVATWSYTWKPKGIDTTFDIEYTMFAHKLYITQAIVQMQVTPSTDVMCSIVNILDGTSAVRANFEESGTSEETGGNQIYTAVTPYGLDNVTAYVYSAMDVTPSLDDSSRARVTDSREYIGGNKSSIAQEVHGELKAMQTTVATKYVGAATSDGFSDPKRLAQLYCTQAQSNGYDASLRTHVGEWATVFRDDSVDVYSSAEDDALPGDELIVESAITAVLNQYYLLQNTISANALANITNDETDASSDAKVAPLDSWSMSVCGLTSDCYGGQVFWDADIWIQPGLVLSHPHAAKQIAKYRAGRYDQAKANAQTSYQSSKGGKTFGKDTAVFPWTSGRFGNCTATGPCFGMLYLFLLRCSTFLSWNFLLSTVIEYLRLTGKELTC